MSSTKGRITAITLLVILVLLTSYYAIADPGGATISNAATQTAPNRTPDSRSDARSTITIMDITAVQKDTHWKGYVGNVSGSLTLDDAANYTIYDWAFTTISGEVYASRWNNITWSSMACASTSLIQTESAFHNMTDTDSDDINSTFNYTLHQAIQIGEDSITASTCNSTFMYMNDTVQPNLTVDRPWQEVLVQDANSYLVYVAPIEDDVYAYHNDISMNQTYDFQLIVAESDIKASPTTYYFYVELG